MSGLQISIYAFTLWMGLYLLERAGNHPGTRYAGLGLVVYAVGFGATVLNVLDNIALPWQPLVALVMLPLWTLALIHLRAMAQELTRTKRILLLAYLGAVFFIMTTALLVIPQSLLNNTDLLAALSVDVVAMGYAVVWLYTKFEGEALLPDALRSLVMAAGGCVLFGGQVALILAMQPTPSPVFQFMLLEIITSVIVLVVFSRQINRFIDRLIFRDADPRQASREVLQETAAQLARSNPSLELLQLDEDEFNRLTRRALRHLTSPHKLVASPLMQLPLIDDYATSPATSLERANALREILANSIDKLKPPHTDASSGITDDWRHYNVLYYPYVVGISPYSTRVSLRDLDNATRHVIEWLRTHVPERTFYNWQKAAAQLVARDLHDQMQAHLSDVAAPHSKRDHEPTSIS